MERWEAMGGGGRPWGAIGSKQKMKLGKFQSQKLICKKIVKNATRMQYGQNVNHFENSYCMQIRLFQNF
jgi:hypothetical protein